MPKPQTFGEDQRRWVKILCKVYEDQQHRGHSWEHKGWAKNTGDVLFPGSILSSVSPMPRVELILSSESAFEPLQWAKGTTDHELSGPCSDNYKCKTSHQNSQKKLHWFWERNTWSILSKLFVQSPEEHIKMVVSHTYITQFKRCPQTQKDHNSHQTT